MCILPVEKAQASVAARMDAQARQRLALAALSGVPVAQIACEHEVSRKFVYQQLDKAHQGLDLAFDPPVPPKDLLFWLPVTRPWVDAYSTYCYLLSQEEHRDGDTWGVRLLELARRGFAPDCTIADFAKGLRCGQEQALPSVPCRGDVFHCLYEVGPLVRYLENRAYDALAAVEKLQRKQKRHERCKGRKDREVSGKLPHARQAEARAIALADDVAALLCWLQRDILAVAGPDYQTRRELLDFVVDELAQREGQCEHRIGPVRVLLQNQGDLLLAFAQQLDKDLAARAGRWEVSAATVREVLKTQQMP